MALEPHFRAICNESEVAVDKAVPITQPHPVVRAYIGCAIWFARLTDLTFACVGLSTGAWNSPHVPGFASSRRRNASTVIRTRYPDIIIAERHEFVGLAWQFIVEPIASPNLPWTAQPSSAGRMPALRPICPWPGRASVGGGGGWKPATARREQRAEASIPFRTILAHLLAGGGREGVQDVHPERRCARREPETNEEYLYISQ